MTAAAERAPRSRKSRRRLHVVGQGEGATAPARGPAPESVLGQVRAALAPRARLATAIGSVLGGFVPVAVYVVAHRELDAARPLWTQLPALLVLGGLLYSASTVYAWGRLAFRSTPKALGFVVLLEGVLVASRTPALSLAALVLLAGINAVATGATLSREG